MQITPCHFGLACSNSTLPVERIYASSDPTSSSELCLYTFCSRYIQILTLTNLPPPTFSLLPGIYLIFLPPSSLLSLPSSLSLSLSFCQVNSYSNFKTQFKFSPVPSVQTGPSRLQPLQARIESYSLRAFHTRCNPHMGRNEMAS